MKRFVKAFLISCWVRVFHLWKFGEHFFRYYIFNWKFFLLDLTLLSLYFFKNPFGLIHRHDAEHPEKPLGPYGETEFSMMEKILSTFHISRDASIADIGCGRGRLCFWLACVRQQKQVLGIELFPLFVKRARKIQHWFHVKNVTFLNEPWDKVSLAEAQVIYFYGSALDDDTIIFLGKKLLQLPHGTKIISTSYWLGEFFPENFKLEATITARFIWGRGQVYLQSVI